MTADERFAALDARLTGFLKRHFGGKSPDADDAILIGRLAAWEGLRRFPDSPHDDGALAYRRAWYAAKRHLRREAAKRAPLLPLSVLETPGPISYPGRVEDFSERLDAAAVVRDLWWRLSEREREVIRLKFGQEIGVTELAVRLGCSLTNISNVIHYGLNRYRRSYGLPLVGASPERRAARRREPCPSLPNNRTKTHCSHGHAYVAPNLRVRADGTWRCRACERAGCLRQRAKERAKQR